MSDTTRVTLDEACRRIRRARAGQRIALRVHIKAPATMFLNPNAAQDGHRLRFEDERHLDGFIFLPREAAVRALRDLYIDHAGRQVDALVELVDHGTILFVN
jgi:hypothetical protein